MVVQVALRTPPERVKGTPVAPPHAEIGVAEPPFGVEVNTTLPVGVIPLFGVAVAVKVTGAFRAVVPLPEIASVGFALIMVWEKLLEVAVVKLGSPL